VKDPSSLKLSLVVAQLFDNEALIHAHILRQDCAFLKKIDRPWTPLPGLTGLMR